MTFFIPAFLSIKNSVKTASIVDIKKENDLNLVLQKSIEEWKFRVQYVGKALVSCLPARSRLVFPTTES